MSFEKSLHHASLGLVKEYQDTIGHESGRRGPAYIGADGCLGIALAEEVVVIILSPALHR